VNFVLILIVIVLLDTLHALCVCVAVMRVQNVVEFFTLFIVAVYAHPHPPQQPLNASKHEPGTVETFIWASIESGVCACRMSHYYMPCCREWFWTSSNKMFI
jgi:hypothetical protein